MTPDDPAPALRLADVSVVRGERTVVQDVDWAVRTGERWVVLGRNGSGKTTLVQIAALYLHPTTGTVRVLGELLGRTDVRVLRQRIGLASPALAGRFRPDFTALDAVMTARHAALEPWWHTYSEVDRERARAQLARLGVAHLAGQGMGTLSSGERQRVLLARTLMTDPGLVLLDEPTAGLDLPGREELVGSLGDLALDPLAPPTVLVTHHVEEIPPTYTHALLLADGRVMAAGPITEVLDEPALSACMGVPLVLRRDGGRWSARAR